MHASLCQVTYNRLNPGAPLKARRFPACSHLATIQTRPMAPSAHRWETKRSCWGDKTKRLLGVIAELLSTRWGHRCSRMCPRLLQRRAVGLLNVFYLPDVAWLGSAREEMLFDAEVFVSSLVHNKKCQPKQPVCCHSASLVSGVKTGHWLGAVVVVGC
jgi:hypothetical protein